MNWFEEKADRQPTSNPFIGHQLSVTETYAWMCEVCLRLSVCVCVLYAGARSDLRAVRYFSGAVLLIPVSNL